MYLVLSGRDDLIWTWNHWLLRENILELSFDGNILVWWETSGFLFDYFLSQRKDVSHCSRTPWCHFAASLWETFCVWGATLNSFYWGINRKGARPLGPPNTVFSSTPKPRKTALDHAFPLGGRQNAWGTHLLLQFQAAVAIFFGVWRDSHEKYAVYSWVWMFEMEVCCGWWIDKSRDPGLDILRLHDQQFHPGPQVSTRPARSKFSSTFIQFSQDFPRLSQNFPQISQLFRLFSTARTPQDPPGPPRTVSLPSGPGNPPGNVLWRSEDLWLHGIQETSEVQLESSLYLLNWNLGFGGILW